MQIWDSRLCDLKKKHDSSYMCFPIKTRFVLKSAYLHFIITDALYNNQLLCQNVTDFTALPMSIEYLLFQIFLLIFSAMK